VGEMRMRLDAARATLLAAVARPPDPDPVAHYGRMAGAKLFTCQTALEVCTLALRTAGGSGYLRTGPLERLLRDANAGLLLPPSHDATLQWLGGGASGAPGAPGGPPGGCRRAPSTGPGRCRRPGGRSTTSTTRAWTSCGGTRTARRSSSTPSTGRGSASTSSSSAMSTGGGPWTRG